MDDAQENNLPLSKTRKKQLAKRVELLAQQLTELPENQFNQLTLSPEIRAEVELARATRGRGSHKRQVKHLAGLLRNLDEELIRLQGQMLELDQVARSEKRDFHQLERLRDRLCEETGYDEAFQQMLELYPQIDRKAISRLAKSVHQYADKRAFREIFKRLREVHEQNEDKF